MTWDTLLRNAFAVGVGLLVAGIGVATALRAVPDLRLRLRGRSAVATVVRIETEPVDAEAGYRDWVVVRFVDHTGTTHPQVRLRTSSTLPPLPGRTVRVRYLPGTPQHADQPRPLLVAVRLAAAPALVVLGLVAATALTTGAPTL